MRGHEGSQHADLQEHDREHEALDALADGLVGRKDRDRGQKSRKQYQQQADTVDTEIIGYSQGLYPRETLDELRAGQVGIEAEKSDQGQQQIEQRDDQAEVPDDLGVVAGDEQ